jgi:hypothetical protein
MFDWPARTKTCCGVARLDFDEHAPAPTKATQARMRGNRDRNELSRS